MRDDGRGYPTEDQLRREWAADLSRTPGPNGDVDEAKRAGVLRSRLLDVMVDGRAALGPPAGLSGNQYGKGARP